MQGDKSRAFGDESWLQSAQNITVGQGTIKTQQARPQLGSVYSELESEGQGRWGQGSGRWQINKHEALGRGTHRKP